MRAHTGKMAILAILISLTTACAPAVAPTAPSKAPAQPAATTAPAAAQPAAPTAAPAAKIKRGGTLVYAELHDSDTWDPGFTSGSYNLEISPALEALTQLIVDEKTNKYLVTAQLAESWEQTNPTTVVFKLRKGVKFHDASDFNAEVAKWHLDRSRTHAKSTAKNYQEAVASIDAIDPSTLKVNLKQPFAPILINLGRSATGAGSSGVEFISKANWDKVGDEGVAKKPIGTGPMELSEWKRDEVMVYKKFAGYWQKGADGQPLPYLDGITVKAVKDQPVRFIEARTGSSQLAHSIAPSDVPAAKANPDLKMIIQTWAPYHRAIGFNQEKEPFGKNIKLRQATQYALDRESLTKTFGFGEGIPDYQGFWTSNWPGYDEKNPMYKFDLEKAKGLVKESGVANPSIELLTATGFDAMVSEAVQAMWDKAGIKTKITAVESVARKSAAKSGNFESVLFGMTGAPDPQAYNRMYTCAGGANWSNYCNPEMDKCMVEAATLYDQQQRHQAYQRCLKVVYEDSQLYATYMFPDNWVHRVEVKGIKAGPNVLDLSEVWLDK